MYTHQNQSTYIYYSRGYMSMKKFKSFIESDGGAIGVGSVALPDTKLRINKSKRKQFDVPTEVFRRFQTGRNKFERWAKFLNLEDSNQKSIYDYAIRNRDATIILRDSETGAMRSIRPRSSNNL